jgi:transcriptional regulator with XRE-family HTH domain
MQPDDEAFRAQLREILTQSGLSMRQLSLAMGRDVGYVAAILDPSRPTRARPTPHDLLRLSDETGIPLVELLERLWGIDPRRLTARRAAAGRRRS